MGLVWIGISKQFYGMHGASDPGLIGRTYSDGCVRMTNWDALELAKLVVVGTPVIMQEDAGSPGARDENNAGKAGSPESTADFRAAKNAAKQSGGPQQLGYSNETRLSSTHHDWNCGGICCAGARLPDCG